MTSQAAIMFVAASASEPTRNGSLALAAASQTQNA